MPPPPPQRSFAVLQSLNSPTRFETRQTCYEGDQFIQNYQSNEANYQYIPENTEFIEAHKIDTASDNYYPFVDVSNANCIDICTSS